MVHLSEVAIQYIWERFTESFIDTISHSLMKKVDAINRAIAHKPFNRITPEHLHFLEKTLTKVLAISDEYAYISLSRQIQILESELKAVRSGLSARQT
jgi:hypothetical protein